MGKKFGFNRIFKQIVLTIILNISATFLSMLMEYLGFTEISAVVIYLLSVLITSRYTKGYSYGIVASFISMLSFNFFFIGPIYTLKVDETNNIFTFVIMLLASIFTSALTSKLIQSKEIAKEREKQAHILYQITSNMAKTSGVSDVATVSVQCLSNLFECDVTLIFFDSKLQKEFKLESKQEERGILKTEIKSEEIEGIKGNYFVLPIQIHEIVRCFVCLPNEFRLMSGGNRYLLDSVIMQITVAMEREILSSEKEAAKAEADRERLKSNLLRMISHDIRTPLTSITGAAEMLLHNLTEEDHINLVQGIYEDSSWLTRLVENILSLTRIQEGKLHVNIQPEAVEEIVSEAIYRVSKYAPNYNISSSVPIEVLFVPMDGKLIEQVLINLVDNAIKHTLPTKKIDVSVRQDKDKVWFYVTDNGTGMNEKDIPKLFDMFFVANSSQIDSKRGMGLGLAICKAIVNFHGGEIYAENNKMGGATFQFYLNL